MKLASLSAASFGAAALSNCGASPTVIIPTTRVRRIGYLTTANAAADPTQNTPSFSQALRELGYSEGRDIVVEARFSEGDRARLPDLATELVRLQVDVIVTTGGVHSALAAKDATSTTPIVFTGFADPVGQGIVPSLSRPGGNITGVNGPGVELAAKRVELLKETIPSLGRVAILFNAVDIGAGVNVASTQSAARSLGLESVAVALNSPSELDAAIAEVERQQVNGIIDTHGSMFYGRGFAGLGKLLDFAIRSRLPQTYNGPEFARVGGLMGLGENQLARWRIVAKLVDKILKGAAPADLPVEASPVFEFVINASMARKIGLTIPQGVLREATEVINE